MSIRPANRINGVDEYYFSAKLKEVRQLQSAGRPVINLGVGNPDLGTDRTVIDELVHSSARPGSHHYQPYRGLETLRKAFADWYGRLYGVELDAATEVLPLMGSKEGIMHVTMAFADPGDRVLVPDPGYPTYGSVATLIFLAGVSAGFYIVPLQALLQHLSPADERGRFLGTANALSFCCTSFGAVVFWIATNPCRIPANRVHLICGALALVGTVVGIAQLRALTTRARLSQPQQDSMI